MSAKSSFVWGWSNINGLDCGGIRLHWIACTEVSEEIRQTANIVGRVFKGPHGHWAHVKEQHSAPTRWQPGEPRWWGWAWQRWASEWEEHEEVARHDDD